MNEKNTSRYDDLLFLPHPTSRKHPRMSMQERAAQFAPFAALTGYDDAVKETARLTQEKIELSDGDKELLNRRLCMVRDCIAMQPELTVTYFVPDSRKSGGAYRTVCSTAKKVDPNEKKLILEGEIAVPFEEIIELQGVIFGTQEMQ